jgi:NADH dehydrogenase I D subunit
MTKGLLKESSGSEMKEGRMIINIGPSHPSTHGAFRMITEIEGEVIVNCEVEIGYVHRGVEKFAENLKYKQILPLTDRLNYVSAIMNNIGYVTAIERYMKIDVPKKAQYIRVILNELSRISDHLTCIGPNVVDIGALTPFWYFFRERERVYEIIEMWTGARLTTSYPWVGGLWRDHPWIGGFKDEVPAEFEKKVRSFLKTMKSAVDDVEALLTGNRIFIERTKGIGVMPAEKALEYGWTGPCLRASGVAWDLRKVEPYMCYEDFDFEIPVGENGDTYDRYLVRMEEIRQSMRIIEQAIDGLPEGSLMTSDPRVCFPPKREVYSTIEGLIRQFELVMYDIQVPEGEFYYAVEAANGELGFYIVSDGTGKPYRFRIRPPCFAIYQAFPYLIKGMKIADLIAVLGSINIIAGELDR